VPCEQVRFLHLDQNHTRPWRHCDANAVMEDGWLGFVGRGETTTSRLWSTTRYL
jgi:hypothetical protein